MRFPKLGAVTIAAIVSAYAAAPAVAFDSNGPMRQGNECKQRAEAGLPDYFAFPGPCESRREPAAHTARASAEYETMMYRPAFDPNGPMRQGTMCKQRAEAGLPDYFAFAGPCEGKTAARRR